MRQTDKTKSVQFLMAHGVDYKNAYRIMYLSKGTAAKMLTVILPEYLRLKASQPDQEKI